MKSYRPLPLPNFWKQAKVIVAGANGFIGSHLAHTLALRGARVYCVVRKGSDIWRLRGIPTSCPVVELDITNPAETAKFFSKVKPGITFNAAAYGVIHNQQDIYKAIDVNLKGSINLLMAALPIKSHRFVNLGTRYEAFRYRGAVRESDPLRPKGVYGITKAAAQLALDGLAMERGAILRTAVLFGVYGPTESDVKFVPYVIRRMLDQKPLALTGCEQIRNYTYVDDAVEALLRLAELDSPDILTVNVGSCKSMPLKELVRAIERAVGVPSQVKFGELPYRSDEIWRLVPDLKMCRKLLGWKPRFSIDEGISLTVSWYKENYAGKFYNKANFPKKVTA